MGTSTMTVIEVDRIRQDFPMLTRTIHRNPLLYLDNARWSLNLRSVSVRHRCFYEFEYANTNEENAVNENATNAIEVVRSSIPNLQAADSPEEIVFVPSATEAMNFVGYVCERSQLQPGEGIVVTDVHLFGIKHPAAESGAMAKHTTPRCSLAPSERPSCSATSKTNAIVFAKASVGCRKRPIQ